MVFRPTGPASGLDDIGHLASSTALPIGPPAASGMEIGRTKDGVIVELYPTVADIRQPS